MSHLLAISVGPVQAFIAAARRTRDLWFGSYLLSEISRAVAKAVEKQGGNLVFPASSAANNVANVILAELAGGDPKEVAAKAKEAAQTRWREFADERGVKLRGDPRGHLGRPGSTTPSSSTPPGRPRSPHYQRDRARVMRLLAGRKHCHDFKQAKVNDAGLPKSSLDGQRATVLAGPKPRRIAGNLPRRLAQEAATLPRRTVGRFRRDQASGQEDGRFRSGLSVGGTGRGGDMVARRPRTERIRGLEKRLSKARCRRTRRRARKNRIATSPTRARSSTRTGMRI